MPTRRLTLKDIERMRGEYTEEPPKPSKFGNKKTADGYDSKAEARRGHELELLFNLGEILDLKRQVVFILVPDQYETIPAKNARSKPTKKLLERKVYYVADFTYFTRDGEYVVEDVKGVKTPAYVMKRKLMRQVHGIGVTEVGRERKRLRPRSGR